MYVAPLNYDRFFKKVFSNLHIAKRFLEDFFDATIEEIEYLPARHKITDDSTAVEFDFRCKMDGRYVIIDMQQWYKTDIVKRFYLYHSVNTALQLEILPLKAFNFGDEEKKEFKDYHALEPVLTLIWLADDKLGVEEDFIAYSLTPELLVEFLREKHLWQNEHFQKLQEKRAELLKLLDNKTKQLDFLSQNRLIYALQKNIVKNAKYKRYVAWFRLAEKSKNRNNKKSDFEEFTKDEIFAEVLRRLNKNTLQKGDVQYIEDYEKFAAQFKQHEWSIKDSAYKEGLATGEQRGEQKAKIQIAENCLKKKMSVEEAAAISDLTFWEVQKIAERLKL